MVRDDTLVIVLAGGAGERLSQASKKVFKEFAGNQRIFRYQGQP